VHIDLQPIKLENTQMPSYQIYHHEPVRSMCSVHASFVMTAVDKQNIMAVLALAKI
jgi:hypothetical protein